MIHTEYRKIQLLLDEGLLLPSQQHPKRMSLFPPKLHHFYPSEKQYSGEESVQSHTRSLKTRKEEVDERKAPHLSSVAEASEVMSETNVKHSFLSFFLIRNCMTLAAHISVWEESQEVF